MKKCFFLFLLLSCSLNAQQSSKINENAPPLVLTIDQLKEWTVSSTFASPQNIANTPLAQRFINTNTQLNTDLSNKMQVIYAPDGMNNLGNYISKVDQFNLFNFTHWQYIDRLIWFGGPILIPAAPWVNAAHRNGVKVYGNIFFAPNVYGGSNKKVNNFLEKDSKGGFIAAQKLKVIVEYYGFDGWFVNMETNVDEATGKLMFEFVEELKRIIPKDKDVIWYDAMLMSGKVKWQNQLNDNNKSFLQDGDTQVSDGVFINFFWKNSSYPKISQSTAQSLGRSPFEIFTGVDLWPGRSQKPFEEGGNGWMEELHENGQPITSLALFVPDLIFRHERYSNFKEDINEADKFYHAERYMFSGKDLNPSKIDQKAFKGLSNWIPAASVISNLPFETNFNTGQGQNYFESGRLTSSNDWHDMNEQDILPTWQFALEGDADLLADFVFDDAYQGGSCIKVGGKLNDQTLMKLYKTKLKIDKKGLIDIVYKTNQSAEYVLKLALAFGDNPKKFELFDLKNTSPDVWQKHTIKLKSFKGKKLVIIALQFDSTRPIENFEAKIGKIKIYKPQKVKK